MAKFRKKPVEIDAKQVFKIYSDGEVEFVAIRDTEHFPMDHEGVHIQTLEGPLRFNVGDWIITGVKGERYACKPDIFELTYEPA